MPCSAIVPAFARTFHVVDSYLVIVLSSPLRGHCSDAVAGMDILEQTSERFHWCKALALPFFQPLPTLGILATYFAKLPEAWPAGLIFVWRFFVGAHAAWLLLALFMALYLVAVENKPAPKND